MIGEILFDLRNSKGWSLNDLAKKTGINKVNLHRYENGTKPKSEALELIAKAFNTTPEELIQRGNISQESFHPSKKRELKSMLEEVKNYTDRENSALYEFLRQINEKRNLISKITAIGNQKNET